MADKKAPKRYEVRIQDKVVRRTDDLESANEKIQELKDENVNWFRFTDRETGDNTVYVKESYQKNYIKTTVPGKLPNVK